MGWFSRLGGSALRVGVWSSVVLATACSSGGDPEEASSAADASSTQDGTGPAWAADDSGARADLPDASTPDASTPDAFTPDASAAADARADARAEAGADGGARPRDGGIADSGSADAARDAAPVDAGCSAGAGAVAIESLGCSDKSFVSLTAQTIGQTFTAPRDGAITGIELSADGVTFPTMGVALYEESATGSRLIGQASRAVEASLTCPRPFASGPGPGFFSLGCVSVKKGAKYRFDVSGGARCERVSSASTAKGCVGGTYRCDADYQCYGAVLGSTSDMYPGGALIRDGAVTGGDLAFRVYMWP